MLVRNVTGACGRFSPCFVSRSITLWVPLLQTALFTSFPLSEGVANYSSIFSALLNKIFGIATDKAVS